MKKRNEKKEGYPYGTVVRKFVERPMDGWTEWALARQISATASYSGAGQYSAQAESGAIPLEEQCTSNAGGKGSKYRASGQVSGCHARILPCMPTTTLKFML